MRDEIFERRRWERAWTMIMAPALHSLLPRRWAHGTQYDTPDLHMVYEIGTRAVARIRMVRPCAQMCTIRCS